MLKKKSPTVDGGEEDTVFDMADSPEDVGDPEIEEIEENLAEALKKSKERLSECQKERQEYLDGWQRAKADYLNSKRRLEAEREQDAQRQAAHFIEKLLPLCDSFDRALADLQKDNDKNWRDGIEQIYNQLAAIVHSYGVEAIEPRGDVFDPHFHEAISVEQSRHGDFHRRHTTTQSFRRIIFLRL